MKKTKYSEEQIAFALRQDESGITVRGGLSNDEYLRSDVFQLEEKVRRLGRVGTAPSAASR